MSIKKRRTAHRRRGSSLCAVLCGLAFPIIVAGQTDVGTIIQRSVEANQRDFNAGVDFEYQEKDRQPNGGTKTYQVTMLDGTPYSRLIAINGRPLPPDQEAQALQKQKQVAAQRRAETPEQRQSRINKYDRGRNRDHEMISQLTKAFDFKLVGVRKLRGFTVWVLRATPRPGYNPPNMNAQVLTGMQGELWIDQQTSQWVRVTAQVIHPVSIEGILAQVEPGTRFEMEKAPVSGGVWEISHFVENANAKVLYMFSHNSQQESWYSNYQRITSDGSGE